MLRTKVGRRFVAYFIVSALVPMVLFGFLADRSVSDSLRTQASERVRRGAKAAATAVHQQLVTLDETIRAAVRAGAPLPDRLPDEPRITRLTVTDASSVLTPVELARATAGTPLLRLVRDPRRAGLQLVQRVPSDSGAPLRVVLADLDLAALVGGVSGFDLVPPASRLCMAMARTSLGCVAAPDAADVDAPALEGRSSAFLRYAFGAPDLTFRLREYEAVAYAPLASFRGLFVPIAIGAVMMAALLAQVTIRRQTAPLDALRDGTKRIAQRDFSTLVPVQSNDEFGELATSFNGMTGQLDRQWQALEMRHQVDVAVLSARTRLDVVDMVLTRVPHVVQCDRVMMLLAESGPDGTVQWQCRRAMDGVILSAAATLSPAELMELYAHPDGVSLQHDDYSRHWFLIESERQRGMHATDVFPVLRNGHLEAALVLSFEKGTGLDDEERRRARQLAAQVAVAFANLGLLDDLRALNRGALEALARTTDANSPWTAGHSVRVTGIAVALAEADGLDEATVELVRQGSLLHDIGKLAVPQAVLDKPGRLTEAERHLIETHPVVGEQILRPVAAFAPLLPMVRSHHERWDGTGYPDRLSGEKIAPLARLLAVADVADSLLSARPYRAGMPLSFVVQLIVDGAGRHFDPHYARLFAERVRNGDAALLTALYESVRMDATVPDIVSDDLLEVA